MYLVPTLEIEINCYIVLQNCNVINNSYVITNVYFQCCL